jgi:hypothetical protein
MSATLRVAASHSTNEIQLNKAVPAKPCIRPNRVFYSDPYFGQRPDKLQVISDGDLARSRILTSVVYEKSTTSERIVEKQQA